MGVHTVVVQKVVHNFIAKIYIEDKNKFRKLNAKLLLRWRVLKFMKNIQNFSSRLQGEVE